MTPSRFEHEAMATRFEILTAGPAEPYARQAAAAAFRELDRLESELSRFVESSDIARANRLPEGGSTIIGVDSLQCLLFAMEIAAATGGAFDPAYATVRRAGQPVDSPLFALDPAAHRLTSLSPRLQLDLGAVGKGYALDRMAEILREWGITSALLQAGGSSVLALDAPAGQPGWPVGMGEGPAYRRFALAHRALGASGTRVQGAHLVDPSTGRPAGRHATVWAWAENAAQADALSTAFFVLRDEEVRNFCAAHPTIGAALADEQGGIQLHGFIPPALP